MILTETNCKEVEVVCGGGVPIAWHVTSLAARVFTRGRSQEVTLSQVISVLQTEDLVPETEGKRHGQAETERSPTGRGGRWGSWG